MAKVDKDFDNRVAPEISGVKPKEPVRIKEFIPWIIIMLFFMWLGMQVATQHIANYYGYQKALGEPMVADYYWFFGFIKWIPLIYNQNDLVVRQALVKLALIGGLPTFACIVIIRYKARLKLKGGSKYLHGSGHWANFKDLINATLLPQNYKQLDILEKAQMLDEYERKLNEKNLFGNKWHPILTHFKIPYMRNYKAKSENEGVFLGGVRDNKGYLHYLRDNGPTHVEVIAPTRSGKGVGLINNTLLAWRGSCFIADLKGELWYLTAGWRQKESDGTEIDGGNNICVKFEPAKQRRDLNAIYDSTGKVIGRKRKNGIYDLSGNLVDTKSPNGIYDENGVLQRDSNGKPKTKDGKPLAPKLELGEELTEEAWNTARWNPLQEIRAEGTIEYYYDYVTDSLRTRICQGEMEIPDTQNVVELIVDPEGKGQLDIWDKTSRDLIIGGILHLIHNVPEAVNMRTLMLMFSGGLDTAKLRKQRAEQGAAFVLDEKNFPQCEDIKDLWDDMILAVDKDGKPYKCSVEVRAAGSTQKNKPDETAQSVLTNVLAQFGLYLDRNVAENTSQCDFHIAQLMDMKKPVSLYLVTQPSDKSRLMPLSRLLVNLLFRLLCTEIKYVDGKDVKPHKNRMLMMLDEFPSLGKLDIIKEALAYCAGYKIKVEVICQDMDQLMEKYGDKEAISSNCHIQAWYAPLKTTTAKIMSEKFGTTTKQEENVSISGDGLKASRSRSIQSVARPLLSPDECMQLPGAVKNKEGKILKAGTIAVSIAGFPGFYGEQSLYFFNPIFRKRASVKSLDATSILPQGRNEFMEIAKNLGNEETQQQQISPENQESEAANEPQEQAAQPDIFDSLTDDLNQAFTEKQEELNAEHEETMNRLTQHNQPEIDIKDPLSFFAQQNEQIEVQEHTSEEEQQRLKEEKRKALRTLKVKDSQFSGKTKNCLLANGIIFVTQLSCINSKFESDVTGALKDLTKSIRQEIIKYIEENHIENNHLKNQIFDAEYPVLNQDISVLELGTTITNKLYKLGYRKIRGLIRISYKKFQSLQGIGTKSQLEILSALARYDLTLNMKVLKDEDIYI